MTETQDTIEAIATTLQGVAFRSRLEARWSLFLDAIGQPWRYEASSVRVHHHTRWPDFWLPAVECWLEIKPAGTVPDAALAQGIADASGYPLIWCAGAPRLGDYRLTLFRPGLPPEPALRWAVGRRDHSELWLCSIESGVAVCLSERSSKANWPTHAAHALKQAFIIASTYWFGEEGA